MQANEFIIPQYLLHLIEGGQWPNTIEEVQRQEKEWVVDRDVVERIFPDFDRIVFMKPPFHTIGDEVKGGNDFWVSFLTNYGEIDYDKAVIIADFGLGSDAVIILYYENIASPVVMYLQWLFIEQKLHHKWVRTHNTFENFIEEIGWK